MSVYSVIQVWEPTLPMNIAWEHLMSVNVTNVGLSCDPGMRTQWVVHRSRLLKTPQSWWSSISRPPFPVTRAASSASTPLSSSWAKSLAMPTCAVSRKKASGWDWTEKELFINNDSNNNGYFQMPVLSQAFYKIMKEEGGWGNKIITQMFLSDAT